MEIMNNLGLPLEELRKLLKNTRATVDIYLCDSDKQVEAFMAAEFGKESEVSFSGEIYELSAWSTLKDGMLQCYEGYGYVHEYDDGDLETDDCLTKIVHASYGTVSGTICLSLDFNGCGEDKDGKLVNFQAKSFTRFMRHSTSFPVAIADTLGLLETLDDAATAHIENTLDLVGGHTLAFYVRPITLKNLY